MRKKGEHLTPESTEPATSGVQYMARGYLCCANGRELWWKGGPCLDTDDGHGKLGWRFYKSVIYIPDCYKCYCYYVGAAQLDSATRLKAGGWKTVNGRRPEGWCTNCSIIVVNHD